MPEGAAPPIKATRRPPPTLEQKVRSVAGAAVDERGFASAIDVLIGIGWLAPKDLQRWRDGQVPYLERVTIASLGKISKAMKEFRRWALHSGLKPSETVYVSHTRDRRPLRFSKSGEPGIERWYRTHWVLPTHPSIKKEVKPVHDPEF